MNARVEAAAAAFVTLTQQMNHQNFDLLPDAEDIEEQTPFIGAALAAADAHDAAHGVHRISIDAETVERAAVALAFSEGVAWDVTQMCDAYRTVARAILTAATQPS